MVLCVVCRCVAVVAVPGASLLCRRGGLLELRFSELAWPRTAPAAMGCSVVTGGVVCVLFGCRVSARRARGSLTLPRNGRSAPCAYTAARALAFAAFAVRPARFSRFRVPAIAMCYLALPDEEAPGRFAPWHFLIRECQGVRLLWIIVLGCPLICVKLSL